MEYKAHNVDKIENMDIIWEIIYSYPSIMFTDTQKAIYVQSGGEEVPVVTITDRKTQIFGGYPFVFDPESGTMALKAGAHVSSDVVTYRSRFQDHDKPDMELVPGVGVVIPHGDDYLTVRCSGQEETLFVQSGVMHSVPPPDPVHLISL